MISHDIIHDIIYYRIIGGMDGYGHENHQRHMSNNHQCGSSGGC